MLVKQGTNFIVACVICLLLTVTSVWAGGKYSVMQYDMVIKQAGNILTTAKVYVKNDKIRMESEMNGMKSINIFDGVKAYMYMPAKNMAMVVPAAQTKAGLPEAGDYKKDCKYLGDETVEGIACGIYDCLREGKSVKMWLDKALEFPVKTESSGIEAYFTNIKTDVSPDDSLFILPADVKVQDMSGFMKK